MSRVSPRAHPAPFVEEVTALDLISVIRRGPRECGAVPRATEPAAARAAGRRRN